MAEDVVDRILALAARRFRMDPVDLRPEQDIFETLGIDSVQVLELLSELEMELDVEIPDYELRDVRTFAGLAEQVARRL